MAVSAMCSILRPVRDRDTESVAAEPDFFGDLNLDQVLASLTNGLAEYRLDEFYYALPHDLQTVRYRQDVLRDLHEPAIADAVRAFVRGMHDMRVRIAMADKVHYPREKQRWFLDAVATYSTTITEFTEALGQADPSSQGVLSFVAYLRRYADGDAFTALREETASLLADLGRVSYCVRVKGLKIRVMRYEDEADYSEQITDTFRRFQQGAAHDYRAKIRTDQQMDHVEAGILDLVARLYPETFGWLENFCRAHQAFTDDTITTFDRDVHFYLAYLSYLAPLREAGLPFCYPQLSSTSKDVRVADTFDLALAAKLVAEQAQVVTNDVTLDGPERILVVTGPNQGGKTTLARTFGQLHHLAALGLLVPGREAQLFHHDQLFTHFPREEDISTLSGKLEDDLERIHRILDAADEASIVIINEIFTSTTLDDARYLGTEILNRLTDQNLLAVYVTFIDELAALNDSIVSMVSTVVPDDPAQRTFKIVRRPADGRAYAIAIAEKYRLTYERLKERIAS